MKSVIIAVAVGLFTAFIVVPAMADGPGSPWDRPKVAEPAESWTGLYVGAGITTRQTVTETREKQPNQCPKLASTSIKRTVYCPPYLDDLVTLDEGEEITGTAFARYLHDFGSLVGGLEAGYNGTGGYGEAQLGLDMGSVLTYGGVSTDGYSAGIDFKLNQSLVVGIKAAHSGGDTRPESRLMYRLNF